MKNSVTAPKEQKQLAAKKKTPIYISKSPKNANRIPKKQNIQLHFVKPQKNTIPPKTPKTCSL